MYKGSNLKSYVRNKIKVLEEFGVYIDDKLSDELYNMKSEPAIDSKCRYLITSRLDSLTDTNISHKKMKSR